MADEMKVSRQGFIFDHSSGRLIDLYDVQTAQLGAGTYGSVSKATNKSTGAVRAVKTMAKKDIKNEVRYKAEIAIMKKLDHPNIIKLFETFEDLKNTYLVLELCTGGELFDRIIDQGFFSEKGASVLMKQILQALYYCHSNKIIHRDLKPENFLFANKSPDSPLKVIDFGLAALFDKNEVMKTKAGTPYYVAPQVLKGAYTYKCDMWSCGVLMYIILCGYPPFYGDTDGEILSLVKLGTYDFPQEDWGNISSSAKELIQMLLAMDEVKRISAEDALKHIWIGNAPSSDAPLSIKVMSNFKSFRNQNRLKKIALTAIAQQLPEAEIKQLKETFLAIDKNGDGTLTLQEIKDGAAKHNVNLPEDFASIFTSMDSDGSGCIDYTEFIAATMEKRVYMQEDLCWSAFRVFDLDGDGKITTAELTKVLGDMDGTGGQATLPGMRNAEKLIAEADTDGDGTIDFDEFMAMMRLG
eukprot:GEMP01008931.1.p1 GENE.GEMP01008931.1~~GEMP01008931.1.p1  ORF type:complete len:468 (+),score=108.98 GEMP01008931.1:96-1499(+)